MSHTYKDHVRFDYAGPFKSRDAAERALEHFYASGEVCEGERPDVERRTGHKAPHWVVAVDC